jgi:hypothetical protein
MWSSASSTLRSTVVFSSRNRRPFNFADYAGSTPQSPNIKLVKDKLIAPLWLEASANLLRIG